MTPKLNPCKDCTERTVEPNCHMTCERYLEQTKEYERVREAKHEGTEYVEFKKDIITKTKKRYNR